MTERMFGRRPRPQDDRDYAAELFLGATPPTQFQVLTDAVARSHASVAVKAWIAYTAANGLPTVANPPVPQPVPPTPTPAPVEQDVHWFDADVVLDQGKTPHCIGYGGAQWGNTQPEDDHYVNSDGDAIYYEAKVQDGEPGQEDGSDVRSLAKVLKNRGRLSAYAFVTTGAAGVRAWIRSKGPVVIGIDWYNDMFDPDANGFLRPTGGIAGGHCLNVVGDSVANNAAVLLNSWGKDWANNGTALLLWSDLDKLLAANGDAMVAVELPVAA